VSHSQKNAKILINLNKNFIKKYSKLNPIKKIFFYSILNHFKKKKMHNEKNFLIFSEKKNINLIK